MTYPGTKPRVQSAIESSLISRVTELEKERDELVEALREVFALIDSEWLVRDTSHDHEPGWALKQLAPAVKLVAAGKVLAKHRPSSIAKD